MRVGESIYLDYQASTPTDARVLDAMLPYFGEQFGNPHSSGHILGWKSSAAVEAARAEVATLIGALPEEVVFTSGATESNNQAIFGILSANRGRRKKLLISAVEHKCVKEASCFWAENFGCEVIQIPVLPTGQVDLDAYRRLLTEDVLLVSIMAVNNEIGTIQDIRELARYSHDYGAIFHCDAAQAPEAIDLDVLELNIDLLSLSAHKIYGPKGIGALYVESSLQAQFPALINGGGQQSGLRSGTLPTPLCVGFGVSASILKAEGLENRNKLVGLSKRFLSKLEQLGINFAVNGDPVNRHPGSLNICFPGVDAESLLNALQPRLCASTGSACNSGVIGSSYVLEAIGLSKEEAASSIRFSLGRYTDESQLDDVAQLIRDRLSELNILL